MDKYEVSIAIVNYNTREWLESCLNSIKKVEPLASYEIYLVDNASTDGSVDFVKKNYPKVHIIENAGNLGFSAAANQAIRTSHGKYVLVLNTDTELDPEAVDILVEFADAHEDVGVVGPKLQNPDGTTQISGRRFPSFLEAFFHSFLGIVWPSNPYTIRYYMLDWDRESEKTVDWVSGAAIFFKREALDEVGLFDERFFMYVEDMDICYRMWKKGFKVYFCPSAKVMHHIGKSSDQSSVKMIVEFQRSLFRFFQKNYAQSWKRILSPLVALALLLRAGILILVDGVKRYLGKKRED